jgi:hypothetical protein
LDVVLREFDSDWIVVQWSADVTLRTFERLTIVSQ